MRLEDICGGALGVVERGSSPQNYRHKVAFMCLIKDRPSGFNVSLQSFKVFYIRLVEQSLSVSTVDRRNIRLLIVERNVADFAVEVEESLLSLMKSSSSIYMFLTINGRLFYV